MLCPGVSLEGPHNKDRVVWLWWIFEYHTAISHFGHFNSGKISAFVHNKILIFTGFQVLNFFPPYKLFSP